MVAQSLPGSTRIRSVHFKVVGIFISYRIYSTIDFHKDSFLRIVYQIVRENNRIEVIDKGEKNLHSWLKR